MIKEFLKKAIGGNNILIAKSLFKSKEEKKLLEKKREFYRQFLTSKNDVFYDVGANYGDRIEPIVNEGFKIVAVEPQPMCISYLKKKFGNKIITVAKGLGEKEDTQTIYISENSVLSSFSKDWITATKESGRFSEFNWSQELKVEVTTLNNLISAYGRPKFIKIDVEGFEYEVLKGLSSPVEALSFEYMIPERKNAAIQCIDKIVEIAGQRKVSFNYSVGESLDWGSDKWLSVEEIKEKISQRSNTQMEFGDIYAKTVLS